MQPNTIDSSVVLSDDFVSFLYDERSEEVIPVVSFRFPCAGWAVAFILEAFGIGPGALGVLTNPDLWSDRGASLTRWLSGEPIRVDWTQFRVPAQSSPTGEQLDVEDPMDPGSWLEFFSAVLGLYPSFASNVVSTALDYTSEHFVVRLTPRVKAGCADDSFSLPKGALQMARAFQRDNIAFPLPIFQHQWAGSLD